MSDWGWSWCRKEEVRLVSVAERLQYITDSQGRKRNVILPMKEWRKIERELERLREKERILRDLAQGFKEVKQIRAGKLKGIPAEDVLNELSD